jgi:polyisoprenoid-binding protein YceI
MKTVTEGVVEVLTFKEGLLSKVAHDLLLSCERFRISSDGAVVSAEFELESLCVMGVMRDGVLDSSAPSDGDRRQILDNVRSKILFTKRHPVARFGGAVERRDSGARITGTLELVDEKREIAFDVADAGGRWRGELELRPTRWGISPFKALLGAIKLQDRVVVRFDMASVPL